MISRSIVLVVLLAASTAADARAASVPGAALAAPFATAGVPWSAPAARTLGARLDALLAPAALAGAHVGMLAVDAATGAPVYARAPDEPFVVASNVKLASASAALARLGPDYRFLTRIVGRAPLPGGTVAGDLSLVGGNDPSLASADLADAARALVAARLHATAGAVAIDAGRDGAADPYPAGWSWDDLAWDYAAPTSAMCLDENARRLVVAPGAAIGALALAAPADPQATVVARTVAAGGEDALDAARLPGGTTIVRGTIPLAHAPVPLDLAVADPAGAAGTALAAALGRASIGTAGPPRVVETSTLVAPPPAGVELWRHVSAPLAEIVAQMWERSDNLFAEQTLLELGAVAGGRGDARANGLAAVRAYLASLGIRAGVDLHDGSGLSVYDRMTPRALVAVLADDLRSRRDVVLAALPIAGVRGTLADGYAGTPLIGRLAAKTGTLAHASALSGYLATRTHGTLVFSFLIDDAVPDVGLARALRTRALAMLAAE